jgi:hypothetical protein
LQAEVRVLIVAELRALRDRRKKKIVDLGRGGNGCDEGDNC